VEAAGNMELFSWREGLRIGVSRLDEQHQRLVDLLNRMHEAIVAQRPLEEVQALAAELTLHTRLHFLYEEMIMEGAEYPLLSDHRFRHAEFTEGLLRLQKRLKLDVRKQFREIVRYELEWISAHLEESDEAFAAWLRAGGNSGDSPPSTARDDDSSISITPER
jgi:hemerythrin